MSNTVSRQRAVCFGLFLLNMAIIFSTYRRIVRTTREQQFFLKNYLAIAEVNDHDVCALPINISAFDESIREYLQAKPLAVECPGGQPQMTYVDDGVLRQNDSKHECYYHVIRRNPDNDDDIVIDPPSRLDPIEGLVLNETENYVYTRCQLNRRQIYETVHFWFRPEDSRKRNHIVRDHSHSSPSVMILVIESLSRLNYYRYLNQTRKVLEQQLGDLYYLNGMNKMADNSFPNMVPVLTGRQLYKGQLPNEDYGPYDDWPLIWKDFAKQGYTTALVEDYPQFTLFNYYSRGFRKGPPTDFYPRPFWMYLYEEYSPLMLQVFPFRISPCHRQSVPKVDIFFDQLTHFMRQTKAANLPYFAFTFFIELTHNDFNAAQTIDSHVAKFLRNNLGDLKDTIFMIMGDHGNRFGPILQTTIGRIEERMPLFAVHVPKKLLAKHPQMDQHLKDNQNRLATWLDVHQMLRDILGDDYSPIKAHDTKSKPSYSPWREPIPKDRTCEQALIPDLYCACDHRRALDFNSTIVIEAAEHILVAINQRLQGLGDRCATLTLQKVLKAEVIIPNRSTASRQNYKHTLELTIKANPSDAIFRTRIFRTAHTVDWQMTVEDVTRLDEYGSQSNCIEQRSLKKFCFCSPSTTEL